MGSGYLYILPVCSGQDYMRCSGLCATTVSKWLQADKGAKQVLSSLSNVS